MIEKPRTTDAEVIRRCTSKIIESGALGRGQTYAKLLTYLAERAIRGEVPKEFDISVDVFGKTPGAVEATETQTRVHVYKLRARLDAYYSGAGKADPFRLEIPKGTYHLVTVANDGEAAAQVAPRLRTPWSYAALGLLLVSLLANLVWLAGYPREKELRTPEGPAWLDVGATARPILIAVGDHFFFGEAGSHVRTRDVAVNSQAELRASPQYGPSTGLVFETLSYLPKSTVFALQTLLPNATDAAQDVSLKLVSELTPEDLRDYDVIYVGFVRAMALLRDYYFTRSNFSVDSPLFMSLTHFDSGEVFTRSGPGPQHNRDYGLFARFAGPSGNQILVFAGIGDVGVSAIVRALHTADGHQKIDTLLRSAQVHAAQGFEVLIEAEGHSRTDLDFRVVGVYPLRAPGSLWPTQAPATTGYTDAAGELSAVEK